MKYSHIIIILILIFGFSQKEDLRNIYSKHFFEDWYQSSNLTILENDTLKELQQIVDAVQKDHLKDDAYLYSLETYIQADSTGLISTPNEQKRLAKENAEIASGEKFAASNFNRKYLFYNSKLKFGIVDKVPGNYYTKDLRTIYFNPVIEQFNGKVIYIDSLVHHKFKKLQMNLMIDNDDAVGYFHHKIMGRCWYSYSIQYAPLNRQIQSLIHEECLDYSSPSHVFLRPVNTIRSIALTKNFKEAAIEIEPDWSTYFYIKKDGKWVINEDKKPLINYIE